MPLLTSRDGVKPHYEEAGTGAAIMLTRAFAGDDEDSTLEPGFLMKRTIPRAGLAVLPWRGHALNLKEPALFDRIIEDFFHQVEAGGWT